jgi:hypothetical protein
VLRIERQYLLQALQGIQHQDAGEVKGQQTGRVAEPALLLIGIDAGDPVEDAFERAEQPLQRRVTALEHLRQVATQRANGDGDECREQADLNPTLPGHFASRCGGCAERVRSRQARM